MARSRLNNRVANGVATVCGALVLAAACRDFDGHSPAIGGGAGYAPSGGAVSGAGADVGGDATDGARAPSEEGGRGGATEPETELGGWGGVPPTPLGDGGAKATAGEPPDASSGQGGEAGAISELSPDQFAGLSLWLEASSEDCTTDGKQSVSAWSDRSGYGNDAAQPTHEAQPKLIPARLNGHAVINFQKRPEAGYADQPTPLVVPDATSLHVGSDDFSYVFVGRWRNDVEPLAPNPPAIAYAGSGGILNKAESWSPYRGVNLMGNYPSIFSSEPAWSRFTAQLALGGAIAFSYADHLNGLAFRVYVAQRVSTDFGIRINGSRQGGTVIEPELDLSCPSAPLVIGGWGGQPLVGDLAEIVLIRGAVSPQEMAALERHLLNKYAILQE